MILDPVLWAEMHLRVRYLAMIGAPLPVSREFYEQEKKDHPERIEHYTIIGGLSCD